MSNQWASALDLHTQPTIDGAFVGALVGLLERTETVLQALATAASPFVPDRPFLEGPDAILDQALVDANLTLSYLTNRRIQLSRPTHCRVCGDELACNDSLGECRRCQEDHYVELGG